MRLVKDMPDFFVNFSNKLYSSSRNLEMNIQNRLYYNGSTER